LTANKKVDINMHKILGIQDITFGPEDGHVILLLRFSKADQMGKGASIKIS
jgi:hypothetical protein